MPTTYYINGPTLSSSTAVFTDAAMTTCAPNGYYADGPIVRQQVGCVLLPEQECPSCGVDCGFIFNGPVNKGVYYFSVELGADTGPVVIIFDPLDYPNGISATFDSTVYNAVVSPTYGSLSAPAGLPTFIGEMAEDCGIVGTHILEEFEFRGVDNSFHRLGTTDTVNVLASQDLLTLSSPGQCVMVIPKPNATPSNLFIQAISPCDLDSFGIRVYCPGVYGLYSIAGNSEGAPGELICGYPEGDLTYYIIPINGDGTTLELYDLLYFDSDCSIPLPDNYYLSNNCPAPFSWFRIENGVIVEFGECDDAFLYEVRKCGDETSPSFIVVSSFSIVIGNTVSLLDPIYEGCRFEVLSTATGVPVASVTVKHNDPCTSICVYYKVYNLDSKVVSIEYIDCLGVAQTTTIPSRGFVYICAKVDSVESKDNISVQFESCQCPS
jgi:hypothetical protein